ncbi:MAG: metalloregulator ArsR/SmtB family transcription factor [Gemmatimonadota bacterium]
MHRDIGNHMVTNMPNASELDAVLSALADPRRRAILERLANGDATVGELAAPFRVSRPAISRHLSVLEDAGLVRRIREGRTTRCRADPAPLGEVSVWVKRYRAFWVDRLDALAQFLEPEDER